MIKPIIKTLALIILFLSLLVLLSGCESITCEGKEPPQIRKEIIWYSYYGNLGDGLKITWVCPEKRKNEERKDK